MDGSQWWRLLLLFNPALRLSLADWTWRHATAPCIPLLLGIQERMQTHPCPAPTRRR